MNPHQELNRRDHLRDHDIIKLRKAGWSLSQIGQKYAVTRQRVNQWLKRLQKEGRI